MTKRTKTPQRKLSSYGTTRIIIEMTQKGKPSRRVMDKRRKALPPGRRVSKAGNVYTERRPNRSDTAAEEIGLSPPDKQTCSLFCDAGLIALGTIPAGSTLRVYYQTPEGQIGETTL